MKEIWLGDEIGLSESITKQLKIMKSLCKGMNDRHTSTLGINHYEIINQCKSIFIETDYFPVKINSMNNLLIDYPYTFYLYFLRMEILKKKYA